MPVAFGRHDHGATWTVVMIATPSGPQRQGWFFTTWGLLFFELLKYGLGDASPTIGESLKLFGRTRRSRWEQPLAGIRHSPWWRGGQVCGLGVPPGRDVEAIGQRGQCR
jgi:hypothetical protein